MNNPPSPNQPISSQQLIIETLNKLSNDFGQANEANADPATQRTADPYRQPISSNHQRVIQTAIGSTLDTLEPTTNRTNQQPQPTNQRLLERIKQATEVRDSNTQIRQGRIRKKLANKLQQALTKLEQLPTSDLTSIQQSLESLQKSVKKLEQSTQNSNSEQQTLSQLTND